VSGSDNRKKYIGVCDPFSSADMMADTTFIESAKFQNLEPLTTGEFGEWQGVRWQESNLIPVYKRIADASLLTTFDAVNKSTVTGTNDMPGSAYTIVVTGYNSAGFETLFPTTAYATFSGVITPNGSTDILHIALPAVSALVDSGYATAHTFDPVPASYNVYLSEAGSTTAFHRIFTNVGAGDYYVSDAAGTSSTASNVVVNPVNVGTAPPVIPGNATGINVHNLFIFGNEWYSVAEISGIKTMLTPSGAQKGDELAQRRSVGWKFFSKCLITNENFGVRIESASLND
jgi:hypothetical protein